MDQPLQITFRGFPRSEALEERIRAKLDKLSHLFGRITRCHVVIEAPHQHQQKGRAYSVSIDLTIPDSELVISRDGAHSDPDVYVAVRDAFEALTRRLQAQVQRSRGEVKHHEPRGSLPFGVSR
jgi:ribosomal subunit interface protein